MSRPLAYYNENDPAAAHVLRELIRRDVILPGEVDTRSIKDVHPDALRGYTQHHFFAGGDYCQADARDGSSYCEYHHGICFTPRNPKAARERAIDAHLRHLKKVRAEAEQSA